MTPLLHWSRRLEYPFIYYQCISNLHENLVILNAGAGLNLQIPLAIPGHLVVSLDSDIKAVIRLNKVLKDSKLKIFPCLADILRLPFKRFL
jgi:hypothetical protein